MNSVYDTDVLVLGIGSAGVGAVRNALRGGASVIGMDRNPGPGGTSTYGGVNNWEPGISLDGIHREIARRLIDRGIAVRAGRMLSGRGQRNPAAGTAARSPCGIDRLK